MSKQPQVSDHFLAIQLSASFVLPICLTDHGVDHFLRGQEVSLSLLLLTGGLAATTETGTLDQVAGALTPDIVERWLSENISTLGDSSTPAPVDAASNAAAPSATAVDAPASIAQPLRAQIANTAGAGVSIRAICINEARTATTLAEGAAVRIIGRGVGDCSGWSVVRAGAKTSWIEDRFLAAAAVR